MATPHPANSIILKSFSPSPIHIISSLFIENFSERCLTAFALLTSGCKMSKKNGALLTSMYFSLYDSGDRKSTRLNSSHVAISYAVFCLKKKKQQYYIIQ